MRPLVGLFVLLPALAFAGAWTREPGHLYAKLGGTFFWASAPTPLGGRGGMAERADFRGEYYALYAEVGVGGGAQVALTLPYARNFNRFAGGAVHGREGLADLGLALGYGLRRGPWAVSFSASGFLPLYRRLDEVAEGEPLPLAPELGDARYDLAFTVTLGRSLWPAPAWIEVDLGHRLRLGELAGGLAGAVRGGYTFSGRVMVMGELRTLRAYGVADTLHPVTRPADMLVLEPKVIAFLGAGLALEISGGAALGGASRDPGGFFGAAVSFVR